MPSFHGSLTMQWAERKPWQLCAKPGLTPPSNTSNLEALSPLALESIFSCFKASCYKYVNLEYFKTLRIPRFKDLLPDPLCYSGQGKPRECSWPRTFHLLYPDAGEAWEGGEKGDILTVQICLVVVDCWHGCPHELTSVSTLAGSCQVSRDTPLLDNSVHGRFSEFGFF